MAKKKKAEKPRREITRRQLARWQQQKRRQRIIFITGVSIIAAVVVMVLLGWFIGYYRPMHENIIKVNDTEFNMRYYIDMLKIRAEGQPPGNLYNLADQVVREIEQDELIRQGALQLRVSASKDEVRQALEQSDLPSNHAARDIVRGQILLGKLQDTYFESEIPKSGEQAQIMAMLLESEGQTAETRERLDSGESFEELAKELSLNPYTKEQGGDLGWHPRGILIYLLGTSVVEDYAFGAQAGMLSQPRYDEEVTKNFGYWLINVVSRGEDEEEDAHVQAMLLGSEEEAEEIRAKLEAGEDFATLAKAHSQLLDVEENGGDLGMITKDSVTDAFDEYVFSDVEPGEISEPIRDEKLATAGGYWLIKVVAKESDREIDVNDRNLMKLNASQEWVAQLWANPASMVDSFLDEQKKEWAIAQVIQG
ncbi:peptidylprolyl isomerase [Chloroflexota bacterium]